MMLAAVKVLPVKRIQLTQREPLVKKASSLKYGSKGFKSKKSTMKKTSSSTKELQELKSIQTSKSDQNTDFQSLFSQKMEQIKLRINCACEPCVKKVRKLVEGMEGVTQVEVDPKQHMLTVIGHVDAEMMIKRLRKKASFVSAERLASREGDINDTQEGLSQEKDPLDDSLYVTIMKKCQNGAEIARAVAMIALRGFVTIDWIYYMKLFPRGGQEFKLSVFKALTKFVLSIYDLEDFEHVVYIDEINHECEEFRNLCIKCGCDPLTAISERKMDLKGLKMIREQDLGNILKWWYYKQSHIHYETDGPKNIGCFAVEPCGLNPISIRKATECLKEYKPMEEKDKMHIWTELKECKCFCTIDAWYMESWRSIIKIQDVQDHVHKKKEDFEKLEHLIARIHNVFYELAATKIAGLRKCQRMVVFPLTSEVFGKWKEEVIEVVRCAEIERRSQRCRFIGVNHLLSCLGRTSIHEISIKKLQNLEPSVNPAEPTTYPIYHIYKSSHEVASALGDPEIGVEHLYLAIALEQNAIEKTKWKDRVEEKDVKDFIESVRNGEGKSSGDDEGETSSEAINLWSRFLGQDGGEKRRIEGKVLPVVIKIQKEWEYSSPLKELQCI